MTRLIRIGNSLGVRIPLAIIQQTKFEKDMDLIFKVTEDGLLIVSGKGARSGWEKKFKTHQKESEKHNLMGHFENEFDKDEWTW